MKSLVNYISEAKESLYGKLEVGSTIYILCDKETKPIKVKIKDIDHNKMVYLENNPAHIVNILFVNPNQIDKLEDENDFLKLGAVAMFSGLLPNEYVTISTDPNIFKKLIDSRYNDQLNYLTSEVNKHYEQISKLNKKIEEIKNNMMKDIEID